jgi:glutamate dehydrogenase (NADP+)
MEGLIRRNPGETEFHHAVREVVESLMPFVTDNRRYYDGKILERMSNIGGFVKVADAMLAYGIV